MIMIYENILSIEKSIPQDVKLIPVSKTKPQSMILEAYQEGQRVFAENKALELRDKHEALPKDIEWHFIGHLQTNKVKYIISYVSLIHSVDRLKILKEINKQAKANNRIVDCLLEFHIAEESSKIGWSIEEAMDLLASEGFQDLGNVRIVGVMGMATYTQDKEQIRREFSSLKSYFTQLKESYFPKEESFKEISMGMSGDYEIAIEEGSTMIRVGSKIFGSRS